MRAVPAILTAGALALAMTSAAAQTRPQDDERGRALRCAPSSPLARPVEAMRVVGGPGGSRSVFGPGERLVVDAGAAQGMRAGDEYFVRRVVDDRYVERPRGPRPLNVHTAGVITILEVTPATSVALITQACDGVEAGDYLERFTPVAAPDVIAGGTPDFSAPAHVILGTERRQVAAPHDFVIVDRGSDEGLTPGQQVTVFRQTGGAAAGPTARLGVATVYAVQPKTATIRIETSVDAVYVGDLVAIHR